MKHVSRILQKLTAVAAVAVALSSCNRAEYAMLPKTTSYHGTQYVAAKPAAQPATEATEATLATAETPAVEAAPEVAVATPAPVAAPAPAKAEVAAPAKAAVAAKPATAPKLNLMQKALVNKVVKKADKVASKMQLKQHRDTAAANRLDGNIRTGVILLIVGLLVSLLSFISGVFGLIGGIIAVVGLIFLLLGLLDAI